MARVWPTTLAQGDALVFLFFSLFCENEHRYRASNRY
jgi:hypothetical protein